MHLNAARNTTTTAGTGAVHAQDLAPLQMVTMKVKRRTMERRENTIKNGLKIGMKDLVAEADPVVGEDIVGHPMGDAVAVLQGQGRMKEKIIQEATAQGKSENPGKREMKVIRDHLGAADADLAQDDPTHQTGRMIMIKSPKSKKNTGMGWQRVPPRTIKDQRFEQAIVFECAHVL